MVAQKYRWDFIGLSTDEKPTSETSDKVVNGSTYYCSDTSKLYVYCDGTWYERKPLGGGGGGTSDFNDLSNRPKYNGSDMTGSTDIPEVKTYTAGSNVTISDQNVISATDTTYSDFTGTDGTAAGTAGLVPAPGATDAGKFLKADGTWDTAGGSGPTVVQTTGTSTTDVMSQNATTSMVFADPSVKRNVCIGGAASATNNSTSVGYGAQASGWGSISIIGGDGNSAFARGSRSIVIGNGEIGSNGKGSISLGSFTPTNDTAGKIEVGTTMKDNGYNNSNYRLLSGVYDGQSDHDAATYGQVVSYAAINGAGAPTTATEGKYVGQLYYDTTNEAMYFLKTIDTTTTPATYTWEALGGGGGGPTVVQTTGTSTTDVMSQNAVTQTLFDGTGSATKSHIAIGTYAATQGSKAVNASASMGGGARANSEFGIAIGGYGANNAYATAAANGIAIGGYNPNASGGGSIAIGSYGTTASGKGSIALGYASSATVQGQMDIGSTSTNYGYNSSNYRLLTGLYDGQSDHDAATVGQIKMGVLSATPTGTTVGFPGRLYTLDTGGGTYEVYLCVHDNGDNTYVWKQVSLI